jgi:hypothetical protein
MRFTALIAFTILSFGLDSLAMTRVITTRTPCPFFNIMIKRMEKANLIAPDSKKLQVTALVAFAKDFGIDSDLLLTLANNRADEKGYIDIDELLDPNRFPAHKGSLARVDSVTSEEFARVDEERLDVLNGDPKSKMDNELISYEQFKAYQKNVCWAKSDMGFIDRKLATGEAHFIWRFFGAYKVEDSFGTQLIPRKLLYDALRNADIPENFEPNKENPATLWSTTCALFTE